MHMPFSKTSRNIAGASSFFLDLLRVTASLVVFYGHAHDQWHTPQGYDYINLDWGHAAVVVFFVLSGYVIAHTTTASNRGPRQYAQARLSKLYSVVFPALIITAIIELCVRFFGATGLEMYLKDQSVIRYFLSSVFSNEVWFLSASPPINGPLWSLSFEFWYYVIFGFFFFKSKNPKYIIFFIVALLIAGPKILIMMPIWLLGNLAYRLKNPLSNISLSWIFTLAFIAVSIVLAYNLPQMPFKLGVPPLFFASQFVTDFIVGIFVAAALWMLPNSVKDKKDIKSGKLMTGFRNFADLTFPLYVLHAPLLVLFRLVWPRELYNNMQMCVAMISVFFISIFIGHFMENTRSKWIALFKWVLSRERFYIKWAT
ncbi:acyltransferase [Flavobacterium zepuense]|uniref:Acyltransferase n=2 Tax=Flavobacterium zepuense TaxID=2593302 RepID=A0A552V2C7_9FLAO|nr:acyltransferase [Flavobacterium zepuense]